jgi:hypothetical protein
MGFVSRYQAKYPSTYATTTSSQNYFKVINLKGVLDILDNPNNVATTTEQGLMSAADKVKLNGIATNANNYSHPTGAGNNHIPSGGSSGQFLKWASSGTATWAADNNTVYTHPTGAGNNHIPSGGSTGTVLKWSSPGTAVWDYEIAYPKAGIDNDGLMSSDKYNEVNYLSSHIDKIVQYADVEYSYPVDIGFGTNAVRAYVSDAEKPSIIICSNPAWNEIRTEGVYFVNTSNYTQLYAIFKKDVLGAIEVNSIPKNTLVRLYTYENNHSQDLSFLLIVCC